MNLGYLLKDELGCKTTIALAFDAFADGKGAPPRVITGDFEPSQPLGPDSASYVRRYGQAGNPAATKGTMDGGERRMGPEAVAPWVHAQFGPDAVDEIDEQDVMDLFFVEASPGQTVYAALVYPWMTAHGHVSPVDPGDGSTIEARLSRLEALVGIG